MPPESTHRSTIAHTPITYVMDAFGLLVLLVSAWFAAVSLARLAAAVTE